MTSEHELRLRRAAESALTVKRFAVVVQWVAVGVFAAGTAGVALGYDGTSTDRWFWISVFTQLAGAWGFAALVLCGSAGLRVWSARLELDVASRYDTAD